MNMITIFKERRSIIGPGCLLLLVVGCGSAPFIQSKDRCDLKRHFRDDIYQVTINGRAISKQFFLREDAIDVARHLSSREMNKCAPREF